MSKKYYAFALIFTLSVLIVLFLIGRQSPQSEPEQVQTPDPSATNSTVPIPATEAPTPIPSITQTSSESELIDPIDEFESRITKKTFGQYIAPQNSPIQPERFTGYHTGVDVEYEDEAGEVEVRATADGEVIYGGYVNGYGGVVIISHSINSNNYLSLYGHLAPSSLIAGGERVSKSQKIGILGEGFSSETDGERRHLHFAIIKGGDIDYRGYVQNESDLDAWVNPIDFINNNGEV